LNPRQASALRGNPPRNAAQDQLKARHDVRTVIVAQTHPAW